MTSRRAAKRTFARILQAVPDPPDLWLVICVLRVFDCADIVDLLARHGLVTERLATTLPQRRFADREFESLDPPAVAAPPGQLVGEVSEGPVGFVAGQVPAHQFGNLITTESFRRWSAGLCLWELVRGGRAKPTTRWLGVV